MKPQIYFFGSVSGKIVSFPQDHTFSFFKEAIKKVKNVSQIVLHRKDNLLYYCYMHRINNNSIFGISLCLDCIYKNIDYLFLQFDNILADLVEDGVLLRIDSMRQIHWISLDLVKESVPIREYSEKIINSIRISNNNTEPLPPTDFSVSIFEWIELCLENSNEKIINATKRYCNLYIVKTKSEIERITSFNKLLLKQEQDIAKLQKELRSEQSRVTDLQSKNSKLKAKQKNLVWVSMLGITVAIMAVIIYFKVINPSEVTHYETGEFVYYGPLKNKKPHGVGVAIYPQDDFFGRKYYIGNFFNGERQDSTAILFYQDGDYFFGIMDGDNWKDGLFYKRSDGTYFQGTFMNNDPYDGKWFKHIEKHSMIKGEPSYSLKK